MRVKGLPPAFAPRGKNGSLQSSTERSPPTRLGCGTAGASPRSSALVRPVGRISGAGFGAGTRSRNAAAAAIVRRSCQRLKRPAADPAAMPRTSTATPASAAILQESVVPIRLAG